MLINHLNPQTLSHATQTLGIVAACAGSIAMPSLKANAISDSDATVELTALFLILGSVFLVVFSVMVGF